MYYLDLKYVKKPSGCALTHACAIYIPPPLQEKSGMNPGHSDVL